jgi:thioredoxin
MNLTQFQQKISSADKPIVVDFWAPWCGPCRMTKPVLEKLANEFSGKVEFLPIDADASRDVLANFRVFGIPTVLAIRDGKVVGRVTGAQNEAGYRALFESLAEGGEVKFPMSTFDRTLRLGAGLLLIAIGISTANWFLLGIGGIVAFLGVYDRCPIWRAITGILRKS